MTNFCSNDLGVSKLLKQYGREELLSERNDDEMFFDGGGAMCFDGGGAMCFSSGSTTCFDRSSMMVV